MPRNADSPLLRWLQLPATEGNADLLLAVRSIGAPNSSDPLAAYIRRLQGERARNERLRLLYVAVTRARLRLYLSGHAPITAKEGRPRPRAGSLLGLLWPALGSQYEATLAATGIASPAAEENAPLRMFWHRLDAAFTSPVSRTLPVPRSLTRTQSEAATAIEFSWVGPLARAAGTVMHGELERLARLGPAAGDGLPARAAACEARLREQGIDAATARSTAQRIIARLGELLREERGQWVLFGPHREARSEVPLTGLVAGELRSIVIDRMLVDAAGTRWIIDYKTGVHAGAGLEEFVARELARYTPQLRLYARLAAGLGPEPVRAALYFPWLGRFCELPAAVAT